MSDLDKFTTDELRAEVARRVKLEVDTLVDELVRIDPDLSPSTAAEFRRIGDGCLPWLRKWVGDKKVPK